VADNLYKLWNRMSSRSYFPGPVRGVEIPKDHGDGVRLLGVPNTADRMAQTAAAMVLEDKLERVFHRDSYGYRRGRSAHDALAACRQRCWKQDWVLDIDVRAFFDSVPHSLLLKAVAHHTSERWVLLYISRWLVAPIQMPDGTMIAREKGTPQGSPISPILANLFMHYAFGTWMDREFPGCPFERYADDVVAHCDTEDQARTLRAAIAKRLPRMANQRAPRPVGHAQVQTVQGQVRQSDGLAAKGVSIPARPLCSLAPCRVHCRPDCGGRMTGDRHVRSCTHVERRTDPIAVRTTTHRYPNQSRRIGSFGVPATALGPLLRAH